MMNENRRFKIEKFVDVPAVPVRFSQQIRLYFQSVIVTFVIFINREKKEKARV